MKAFEKWWNSLLCSNNKPMKIIGGLAWKAALEWAHDKLRNENNGYFAIVKELEDLE